ncbi:Putative ribonuclease H protein At1g65750 [Linum perenne]
MAKLAFLFMQKPEALWVQVLQSKYLRENRGELRPRNTKSQSALWRGISKAWGVMLEGARTGIGNGKDTKFWTGNWLDSGVKLIDCVADTNVPLDLDAMVSEFVTASGDWDFGRIRNIINDDAVQEVAGMLPPCEERGEDTWVWGKESNGKFSVRSAYAIIIKPANLKPETAWDLVWKWSGPSRVQHFLWLVAHEKLMTNLERKRRHLSDNTSCPRCTGTEESVLHVIRDCHFAKKVWDELAFSQSGTIRSGNRVDNWLKEVMKHERATEIGIICWYLWKERNDLIFNGSTQSPVSLASKIKGWISIIKSALDNANMGGAALPTRRRVEVAWEPGPPTWVNLGRCSITRAELRGVIGGLTMAWDMGARRVMVQVDSQVAIALISEKGAPCHQHAGEVITIRKLLQRDWEVTISHIYREGNQTADYLADIGHGLPPGTHSINVSDSTLCYFLRRDCMGISDARIIST